MGKVYNIEFSPSSRRDYDKLRAYDKRRTVDSVEKHLTTEPLVESKNRKCLGREPANFDYASTLWELRIGPIRVYYEVDQNRNVAYILAVRLKPPNKTTREVLNEANGD
jgi:mRNA-degrading endonuclease RelE of RelBE toxin-antitoxin system